MLKDIRSTKPRLSRLGVIRLGTKHKDKHYPIETPHFVLTDAPDVACAYPDNPTDLLIYLPFPTVHENFTAYHELWGGLNACLCRGDGERILTMLDPENKVERVIHDGQVIKPFADHHTGDIVTCPGLDHSYPRCAGCAPVSRLIVLVRDPQRPTQLVADRFGYYQISTRSIANYKTLLGQLEHAFDLADKMNPDLLLQGIPMILKRVPTEMSYVEGNGNGAKRKNTTHYLLDLEFDLQWVQMVNARMHDMALGGGDLAMLPDRVIDAETGEIIDSGAVYDNFAADLEALKDNLPADWREFHHILKEMVGPAYSGTDMMAAVRERLALQGSPSLTRQTWETAIDLIVERIGAVG